MYLDRLSQWLPKSKRLPLLVSFGFRDFEATCPTDKKRLTPTNNVARARACMPCRRDRQ